MIISCRYISNKDVKNGDNQMLSKHINMNHETSQCNNFSVVKMKVAYTNFILVEFEY